MTDLIFAKYDSRGVVENTIVADSLEWCVSNLGGKWAEVTAFDGPFMIDVASGLPYNPLPTSVIGPIGNRETNRFAVWIPVPKASIGGSMPDACSTDSHAIFPPALVWSGVLNPTDVSDPEGYATTIWAMAQADAGGAFSALRTHHVLYDARPHFAIVFNATADEFARATIEASRTHPHITGASAHELLRVIYEWHWAHNELGSTEPAAVLGHRIWEHLSPPVDVVEAVASLREMAVSRFLFGQVGASEPHTDYEPCPKVIVDWWESIITPFPPLGNQVVADDA